ALPGAHAHIHQPIDDEDVDATVWIQPDGAGTHLFGLEISGGYNYTLKIDSIWADDGVTLPPEEREAATGVVVEKSRLRGSGRDVIKLTPGTDGTALLHNEIFDSGQRFAGNAECVDNVNSSEMLMIGNHLHDCATNGVYAKGGARNVRIERNLVRDTGAAGIVLGYDDTDVEWFSPETNPEYFENLQGSVTNNFVM